MNNENEEYLKYLTVHETKALETVDPDIVPSGSAALQRKFVEGMRFQRERNTQLISLGIPITAETEKQQTSAELPKPRSVKRKSPRRVDRADYIRKGI